MVDFLMSLIQQKSACRRVSLFALFAVILAACGGPSDEVINAATVGATRPLELTSPDSTPAVDRSQASVELSDIVFDTFNGGSFTLAEGSDSDIAFLFDAIAPIDAPDYETVESADWLNDDDVILGYVDPAGDAWAYPTRILNSREIVNDELGGQPVLISYCPLCGSGVVYDRILDGQELSFSNTSALLDNDMVMVDRETGSYWWQVAGSAVVGQLNESRLVPLASQTTTWESWTTQFPDSSVLVRPDGRNFGGDSFSGYGARLDGGGSTPFPLRDNTLGDGRLPPSTQVVFAEIGGEAIAWDPSPARSFSEEVGGQTVDIVTDGLGAIVTIDGDAVPTRSAFWFAALTVFPDLELSPS